MSRDWPSSWEDIFQGEGIAWKADSPIAQCFFFLFFFLIKHSSYFPEVNLTITEIKEYDNPVAII